MTMTYWRTFCKTKPDTVRLLLLSLLQALHTFVFPLPTTLKLSYSTTFILNSFLTFKISNRLGACFVDSKQNIYDRAHNANTAVTQHLHHHLTKASVRWLAKSSVAVPLQRLCPSCPPSSPIYIYCILGGNWLLCAVTKSRSQLCLNKIYNMRRSQHHTYEYMTYEKPRARFSHHGSSSE